MRIELSSTGDAAAWQMISAGLVERYRSAKDGIYQLAVNDEIVDE